MHDSSLAHPHVVVMGVSGCGKSTVARGLAGTVGLRFADADDFHPPANVEKMAAGVPLDDADRLPWLRALAAWTAERAAAGEPTAMACSALTRAHRDVLRGSPAPVAFIHLDGPPEVVAERLAGRDDHFMPPSLLDSQVATLEPLGPDEEGVVLDLARDPATLVAQAAAWVTSGVPAAG